jgi:hypothetical protein
MLGSAELHLAVGRVNFFFRRQLARYQIEIPVARCVVAAAVHGYAFKNARRKERRNVGCHFAIVDITQRGFRFAHARTFSREMPEAKAASTAYFFRGETVILSPAVDAANWLECKTSQEPVQMAHLGLAEFDRATERAHSAMK